MSQKPPGSQKSGTGSALPLAPRGDTMVAYSVVIICTSVRSFASIFHVYLLCRLLRTDASGGVTLLKCHSLVPMFICRPFKCNCGPRCQYGDYVVMMMSLAVVLVEHEIVGRRQTNISHVSGVRSGNSYSL